MIKNTIQIEDNTDNLKANLKSRYNPTGIAIQIRKTNKPRGAILPSFLLDLCLIFQETCGLFNAHLPFIDRLQDVFAAELCVHRGDGFRLLKH